MINYNFNFPKQACNLSGNKQTMSNYSSCSGSKVPGFSPGGFSPGYSTGSYLPSFSSSKPDLSSLSSLCSVPSMPCQPATPKLPCSEKPSLPQQPSLPSSPCVPKPPAAPCEPKQPVEDCKKDSPCQPPQQKECEPKPVPCEPKPVPCEPKPTPCEPKPEPCKPVANNQYGYLTGDPHLRGGDGELYNIHGKNGDIFNVLHDSNIDYNVKYGAVDGWDGNAVTESAIAQSGKDCKSVVKFDKSGNAVLLEDKSGKSTSTTIEKGKTYALADGGSVKYGQAYGGGSDGSQMEERLIITTGEGYTITQAARSKGYIDSNIETGSNGVASDNVLPSGLIGDTFDADSNARVATDDYGKGVLNNDLSSYKRSSLF